MSERKYSFWNTGLNRPGKPKFRVLGKSISTLLFLTVLLWALPALAMDLSGQKIYERISKAANSTDSLSLIQKLKQTPKTLDWGRAGKKQFPGNLRIINPEKAQRSGPDGKLYLIRSTAGDIYIIDLPLDSESSPAVRPSFYSDLDKDFDKKLTFTIQVMETKVAGQPYAFARLLEKPEQTDLDKGVKIGIVLLLFSVMVGMGMTLTPKDFMIVFAKPKGMLIGQIMQFAAMPLLAMALGHLSGFYQEFPFIFVGLILITATPGGVTSNLMTYYAKGDLALSISLTSLSTVLSIVFTPLLLTLYCTNIGEVTIPVENVIQTIIILVLIPLALGMSFKWKWSDLADRCKPFFSALGMIALLVLVVVGTMGNYEIYTDTTRYGLKFYAVIFSITMLGMLLGIIIPKLFGVDNYQTRAISLETGLRNSALAMTIALLLQDPMGDFYGSMLFTSAIFGLAMYLAGIIAIYGYQYILPLEEAESPLEPTVEYEDHS